MRTTIRRFLLLFYLLRYGAHLLWIVAPRHHQVGWIASLITRMHGTPHARAALNRALPQLGPLAGAFREALSADGHEASIALHDVFERLGRMESALTVPLSATEWQTALRDGLAGRPPADVFASIDPVPLQNGIAEQVHSARLHTARNGHTDVRVKLVRVQQLRRIEDDLAVLRWVARVLDRWFPAARRLALPKLADWLAAETQRRFDLRTEAANLSQTARQFAADSRVVVPAVIWDLSNDHLLVTQHIETRPMTDLEELRRHGVQLDRLAAHVVEVAVHEAFEHGFFHAALDAARMRVSIEVDTLGCIVMTDGAIMSSLTEPEREFFIHGARAMFDRDYGKLALMHHELGHVTPGTRAEMLEGELRTRGEAHFAVPTGQRRAGDLLRHVVEAVKPYGGAVPPALDLARQTLARAESLARQIAPEVDTWRVAEAVFVDLARKDVDHRGWIKRLSRELPHLAPIVPRLPLLVVKRLERLHRPQASMDTSAWLRELIVEQQRTRRLLWACVLVGTLLGAAMTWLAH